MDIAQLPVLIDVARFGGFAAAARHHDLDPSSVSRLVSAVEAEIGVRIFQRTTRRLTVTEAGAAYLRRMEAVVDEIARAREEAATLSQAPAGTLRITASVSFGTVVLVPVLAEFQRRFPDLTVDLVLTDRNLDLVADRIDLGIRLAPEIDGDVVCSQLIATRYRVCASPQYLGDAAAVATPEDLSGHRCVLLDLPGYRTAWRFLGRDGRESAVAVSGSTILSNALAVREAVAHGLGVALLADWLIADDLTSGRLVDVFPECEVTATTFETGAWVVYPSRSFLPRKVRVMVDYLREALQGSASARSTS